MPADILVGDYLFARIKQLGVKTIFGVPGDYELALLDLIPAAGLVWKGSPNELNASYAADGYARINGVGALVTTYGPGELSALCGVAGGFCEYVPLVHVVGYPSVQAQRAGTILHHSLGHGTFTEFHDMSRKICAATTVLMDAGSAAAEIDRCLNAMMLESRPVYIGVPTDVAYMSVPSAGLSKPLTLEPPENDAAAESKAVEGIRAMIEASTKPIVLVDGLATRNRVLPEVQELLRVTGFPYFVTAYGKGAVSEEDPRFGGVYAGMGSKPDVREAVESSDCILFVGSYPSDFNTGDFTEDIKPAQIVDFQRFSVTIAGEEYRDVKMKYLLPALSASIAKTPLKIPPESKKLSCSPYPALMQCPPGPLTQEYMWPRLAGFLQDNDTLVVETGTSQVGILQVAYPAVRTFMQTIFGSIGFAAGASVGAFVAAEERGDVNRNVLVTGDGSLQLTVQAFADLLRHDLRPIIILLNNGGYTVERMIHGMTAPYNDIPDWSYATLLQSFGPAFETKAYQVRSCEDWDKLLASGLLRQTRCTQLVEVFLDKEDAPAAMRDMGKAIDAFNARK